MNAAPALLVAALVACDGRAPTTGAALAEAADLAGLRAALARDVAAIAGASQPDAAARAVLAGWQVPAEAWPALVTPPFRPHHAAYAAAFVAAAPAATGELRALAAGAATSAVEVRWQYADDPALTPAQARLRVALPVGRPGAIVTLAGRPLAPVFVHDGRRWRALLGLEQVIALRLAARAPACVAPYVAAAREPCLAMSAPVIHAVLADDDRELERACTRLQLHGC